MKPELESMMQRVRLHCVECGDCLIWQAACDGGAVPYFRPFGRKTPPKPVRRVLAELMGKKVDGRLASTNCGQQKCVAPAHIALLTRKQLQQRTTERTRFQARPSRNQKLQAAHAWRRTVPDEVVAAIRASDKSSRALAKEHGISQSHAAALKAGRVRKDYASPWAGLMP